MNFQEWIDLFEEQWFFDEWLKEFELRESEDLEKNWYGSEDWLYSTHYTNFICNSFVYHGEGKWEDIEKQWRHTYEEYE